jgi:hypothetical protein
VSEVPEPVLVGRLRAANARLRELLADRDAQIAALLAARDTEIEASRQEFSAENARLRGLVSALGLRIEALERQLASGSDDSGTPTSKESLVAKARRKARARERKAE